MSDPSVFLFVGETNRTNTKQTTRDVAVWDKIVFPITVWYHAVFCDTEATLILRNLHTHSPQQQHGYTVGSWTGVLQYQCRYSLGRAQSWIDLYQFIASLWFVSLFSLSLSVFSRVCECFFWLLYLLGAPACFSSVCSAESSVRFVAAVFLFISLFRFVPGLFSVLCILLYVSVS